MYSHLRLTKETYWLDSEREFWKPAGAGWFPHKHWALAGKCKMEFTSNGSIETIE